MRTSRRTLIVEWGDCDPACIVFDPRCFDWFDASMSQRFESGRLPKPELLNWSRVVGFPLADARAEFLAPSGPGKEVVIETRIFRFGRGGFDVEHRRSRDGALCVGGCEKRVLAERNWENGGLRPYPEPAKARKLFAA